MAIDPNKHRLAVPTVATAIAIGLTACSGGAPTIEEGEPQNSSTAYDSLDGNVPHYQPREVLQRTITGPVFSEFGIKADGSSVYEAIYTLTDIVDHKTEGTVTTLTVSCDGTIISADPEEMEYYDPERHIFGVSESNNAACADGFMEIQEAPSVTDFVNRNYLDIN